MRDAEGGAGQSILRNLIPAEFAIDASLENRNGAVGKLDDFFHIGRNHDNCNARILELTDDVVYVAARSRVNAAGRLIEDDDLRRRGKRARDDNLLLVAAGETAD